MNHQMIQISTELPCGQDVTRTRVSIILDFKRLNSYDLKYVYSEKDSHWVIGTAIGVLLVAVLILALSCLKCRERSKGPCNDWYDCSSCSKNRTSGTDECDYSNLQGLQTLGRKYSVPVTPDLHTQEQYFTDGVSSLETFL